MLASWGQFVNNLGRERDTQLDRYELNEFIKTEDKSIPSYKIISTYFQEEYAQKTVCKERSKWHWMDKAVLIWTMFKHVKQSKGTIIKPVQMQWKKQLEENYIFVSQLFGLSVEQIKIKWMSLLKTKVKESPWTQEEDDLILELKKFKQKKFILRQYISDACWTKLSLEFNSKDQAPVVRYSKQIRERWNNFLNPKIKKLKPMEYLNHYFRFSWPVEEKIILLENVQSCGKKWSKISKHLPGRTDNQVKNQFNIILNFYNRRNTDPFSESKIIEIALRGLRDLCPEVNKSHIFGNIEKPENILHACKYGKEDRIENIPELKKIKIQKQIVIEQTLISEPCQSSFTLPQKGKVESNYQFEVPVQIQTMNRPFHFPINSLNQFQCENSKNLNLLQFEQSSTHQNQQIYQNQVLQNHQYIQNQQFLQQQQLISIQQLVQHQQLMRNQQIQIQQMYNSQSAVKREDF